MSFDLDQSVIEFNDKQGVLDWTVRNAVEGVQIFGGIGSGKTSGSGRLLALKYLSSQFGGIVLTVKEDEVDLWREYCQMTDRTHDLVVIEPGSPHSFNFLEYESQNRSAGKSTGNIVQVIKTVIRASEEKASGKSDDPFWETALDMLMHHIIDLCMIAYGKVSVELLYDIAQTVPKATDDAASRKSENAFNQAFHRARANVMRLIDQWWERLPETKRADPDFIAMKDQEINDHIPEARLLQLLDQFFMETFRNLSEKTRSIIDFSFTGFLFRLLQEPIYSLFCKRPSTIVPEDCLDGKIIVINLPVKIYDKTGRDTQILFKYIWQRAMERRRISENDRPVFLWADEAQNFLHEHDATYQATARSSRIATVYISQNLPNYFASIGGKEGNYKVKSFLGTLSTKIFHANADIETNRYASDLIGEGWQKEETESIATSEGKTSHTNTITAKLQKIVRPEEFGLLKTGGPENDMIVTGYIHVQGKKFPSGFNHKKIIIPQSLFTQ